MLERTDRLVEETHLLVRDAQVVVRPVVVAADLLRDVLPERGEDLLDADPSFRDVRDRVAELARTMPERP